MIPKIRFNEFTDEYEDGVLSDYLFENKERNKKYKYSKEEVLSVSNEKGLVNQIEYLGRSYAGEDVGNYHVVLPGDIVYTKSPLSTNPYGIIKYNQSVAGIVSTLYAVYRCNTNALPQYIDYFFGYSERINKYLKPLVNIGAKHDMKINNSDALSGEVSFPTLDEQKKVCEFISAIDKKIEFQDSMVLKLVKRKQGILNKVFSGELRLKDNNQNDYPDWETKLLGDFFEERKEKSQGDEQLLSVTIGNGVIPQNESNKDDNSSDNKKNYKKVYKGDIAYNTMRMWQGAEGVAKIDGIVSPAYTVIKPKKDTNSTFFSIIFKSNEMLKTFTSYSQGLSSDNWNLKFDTFADLEVDIPSAREQEKIVKLFELLQKQLDVETEKLLVLKAIKKGLLQQMFC